MNDIHSHQLLILGGPAMIPILIASFTALTIILSKFNDFKKIRNSAPQFKAEIFSLIRDNKIKAAVIACENKDFPLSHIFKSGLLEFSNTRDEIKESLQTAITLEMARFERGLTPLVTIANITPLFGILGTVLGMAVIFQTISVRSAGMNPVTVQDLAGGAWQALLTTIAGLLVAIPAFVAYNYFVTEVTRTVNELERAGEELIQILTHARENNSDPSVDAEQ